MAAELGYNIAFKVNNKTFAGRTQDDLTITPTIKESITKDDAGQKNSAVTGKEVTFSCQGLVILTDSATTKLVRDDCIITGYSESSNSEDEATYSVDLKSTGAITFATGS